MAAGGEGGDGDKEGDVVEEEEEGAEGLLEERAGRAAQPPISELVPKAKSSV